MCNVPGMKRRGVTLIYAFFACMGLVALIALSVDWGRVQLTKTELHAAAVAAARYAVAGLQNDLAGVSAAPANAAAVAAQNTANGRAIAFNQSQDVEIGVWDTSARTFTPTTDLKVANAVHVTMRCSNSRGTGVPLLFLGLINGSRVADISSDSIAMINYQGVSSAAGNGRFEYFVPATDNPWLSGMPSGSIASVNNPHNNPDYAGTAFTDAGTDKTLSSGTGFVTGGSTSAGSALSNYAQWGDYAPKKASPIQAGGITISGGVPITMDGVNGGATNAAGQSLNDADGATNQIVSNSAGAENGIANVSAPINSTIGVFLDDKKPSKYTAPEALDFSTDASRDFKTLSPKLRQPFFIGDGRTSSGEVQQFIPPAGATRLFLATMDAYEWSNNVGGFYITAHIKGKIVTVK